MDNKTIELHTIATFQGKEYELENLLNGLLNKLEEKDKEIERLKAREEEIAQKYLSATKYASEIEGKYVVDAYIINELEKYLEERIKSVPETMTEVYEDTNILNRLKKLKEGNKE